MAMLCGEMIFPAVVPVVLAAANQEGSICRFAAISACSLPNKILADVPLPVMKVPASPTRGAQKGYPFPAISPKVSDNKVIIPAISMTADMPINAITMMIVERI